MTDDGPGAGYRVCMDPDRWQVFVWDGEARCRDAHPLLHEVGPVADDTGWCADYVESAYGPLAWYALTPTTPPPAAPPPAAPAPRQ